MVDLTIFSFFVCLISSQNSKYLRELQGTGRGTGTGSWCRCFTPRRSGVLQRTWPQSRRRGRRHISSPRLRTDLGNSPVERNTRVSEFVETSTHQVKQNKTQTVLHEKTDSRKSNRNHWVEELETDHLYTCIISINAWYRRDFWSFSILVEKILIYLFTD